jgi:hypothetical protein
MQENLLQFIWEKCYFNRHGLTTHQGEPLEILSPGIRNKHQGPDFMQARIRIGVTEWVGNVELHTHTGDWHRHGHDADPRYQNLILHVVWRHQGEAPGQIPILVLEGRVAASLLKTYTSWMNQPVSIPCAGTMRRSISMLSPGWRNELLCQRLALRAAEWLDELKRLNGHWEALAWRKIARNFGYRVNADVFDELARSLPLGVLAKHKTQIHQVEALLFGQAGLLSGNWEDPYPRMLQKEYAYLKRLHRLNPVGGKMQFLRMRPGNFPSVRLAQLAILVHHAQHLFTSLMQADSIREMTSLLEVTANDYWHYHYHFGKTSTYLPKTLGTAMIHNIIMNTVVPLLYAYGQWKGDPSFEEKAFGLLCEMPPERDASINMFVQAGLKPVHAADTQALHFLYRAYCDSRRCLDCSIGVNILNGQQD